MQIASTLCKQSKQQGYWDCSGSKDDCLVKGLALSNPLSPHKSGKRELPTPSNCPLTSTHAPRHAHMCAHTNILLTFKNVKRRKASVSCFTSHPFGVIREACCSRFNSISRVGSFPLLSQWWVYLTFLCQFLFSFQTQPGHQILLVLFLYRAYLNMI